MMPAGTDAERPKSTTGRMTNEAADKEHHQVRKMQSGSGLHGVERGESPISKGTPGSTAGMKTEYVDDLKFVVLNGSPARGRDDGRPMNQTRPGNGKRTSYHHTAEGIPVPPPLLPEDHFSPDLQDKEYDFLHDAFQTSKNGDFTSGSHQHSYAASSIGTASSNSSAGSRLRKTGPMPCDTDQKIKQKRSSVFSSKTKASKKDGYVTGDEVSSRAALSTKSKKESKRMSYTFGQSFTKSKTPRLENDHLPLPVSRMNMTGSTGPRERPSDLPLTMAVFLRDAKTFEMDVDRVKRLRLLLGSESTRYVPLFCLSGRLWMTDSFHSTSWVQTFIDAGGYKHLLSRLKDLLDIEWRCVDHGPGLGDDFVFEADWTFCTHSSEQHDDQLFFEILRCIKGLTTSEVSATTGRKVPGQN